MPDGKPFYEGVSILVGAVRLTDGGTPMHSQSPCQGTVMESQWQTLMNSIGLLILRLGIGGFMASHGWGKFQMMLTGDFDNFADPIGLGKGLSLVLVVMAEFFGALLVMLGLATRFAAATVVFAMA